MGSRELRYLSFSCGPRKVRGFPPSPFYDSAIKVNLTGLLSPAPKALLGFSLCGARAGAVDGDAGCYSVWGLLCADAAGHGGGQGGDKHVIDIYRQSVTLCVGLTAATAAGEPDGALPSECLCMLTFANVFYM